MKVINQIFKGIVLFCVLFVLLGCASRARSAVSEPAQAQTRVVLCDTEKSEEGVSYFVEMSGQAFVARDGDGAVYAEREVLSDLLSLLSGASVTFCEVRSDEPLSLTRPLTFSGDLSVPLLVIDKGASVRMLGGTLLGSLSVKNGAFTLCGGEIEAQEGSAVRLEYMASALFHMIGGRVSAQGAAAICAPVGTVVLGGGRVESTGDYAVVSSATLTLYGAPTLTADRYGVSASRPLHLSYADEPFCGRVSVEMNTVFTKGSFSPVAYDASEESTALLSLFDAQGNEMPLQFFEQSTQSDQTRLLAVSLPYEISFYADGACVGTLSLYEGEILTPPTPPERLGFRFLSYRDSDAILTEGARACGDAAYYASYELCEPTFTLSDLSFVYDGKTHSLALENLYHPLMTQGYFSYTWYYEGELLKESAPALAIKNTTQSGRYRVEVLFTYLTESVRVKSDEITLTVSPLMLTPPEIGDKIYDATHLYANVTPNPYYKVKQNEGGVDAGEYEVTLTLTDPVNTVWQGSEKDTVSVRFRILRATNRWLSECWARDAYLGRVPEYGGHGLFGETVVEYARAKDGPYSAVMPGTAGIYYLRLRIVGCANYTELLSEPVRIELFENRVISIRIETAPTKTEYTAFEAVELDGICVSATYLDGTVVDVDTRSLRLIYDTYTSYLGGTDGGVTVAYGEARARLALQVSRAKYDLSAFAFSDLSAVYTGGSLSILPSGEIPLGRDGSRLSYRIEGAGVDVGTYAIKLFFFTESNDYQTPPSRSATLKILPKTVTLSWQMLTFVYDGGEKTPSASFVGVFGETIAAVVSGGKIKAGDGYVATASEPSGNYIFENASADFHIEKASYDLSGVRWSAESFTYDSAQKQITLLGLPEGVMVKSYLGNMATEAGEYAASAQLLYDAENFVAPSVPQHAWRILPASYDLSEFEILGGGVEYDGELHYPEIKGNLRAGLDGIAPTFTFSGGVREVAEGKRTVEVVFHTESENYLVPESIFVELWITPAPITVEWSDLSFTYDGTSHLPRATHASVSVSVVGSGTDAGEFVASATSEDPNFYIKNARITFVIQKAKNEWITPLCARDIFTSGKPDCFALAKHGEVQYLFYDEEGARIEAPEAKAGYYDCVAVVGESENYLALTSERCRFLVREVIPVGIEATLTKDALVAYRKPTAEQISVLLLHNDGTRLPISDYTLVYQSADSPRCSDETLIVQYGNFSFTMPVSVVPATLSVSDITLSHWSAVYTGREIELSVLSMPEGVSLVSIESEPLCDAGSYEILFRFSLDPENYEGDGTIVYTFVIEKREINLPILPDRVYNGAPYVLPDLSDEYELANPVLKSEAGEHMLGLRLKDPENTCFAGGEAIAELAYRITRAPLTVKIADLTVYSDGFYEPPSYEVTEGVLYASDTLIFTPKIGDTVSGVFENDNYEIRVIEGALVQSKLSSPQHQERTQLYFFVLVAALLLLLFVITYRKQIFAFVGRIRLFGKKGGKTTRAAIAPEHGENAPHPIVHIATPLPLALPSPRAHTSETDGGAETPPSPRPSAPEKRSDFSDASDAEADVFQISFDFFENGERALSGRMMDEEALHIADSSEIGVPEPIGEIEHSGEDAEAAAESGTHEDERAQARTVPTRARVQKKRKKAKKRKKQSARVKKTEIEAMLSPQFAPWHRNGAGHAERRVAHRCEENARIADGGSEGFFGIGPEEADRLLSDRSAEALVLSAEEPLLTYGHRRVLLPLDTIAARCEAGERVDLNLLKERSLIPHDTLQLRVLARGTLAKALVVCANDFEPRAIKMLLLAGGKAIRQRTKSTVARSRKE